MTHDAALLILIPPRHDSEEQLQGAGAADAGGDHGDADLLWPGLCRGEG